MNKTTAVLQTPPENKNRPTPVLSYWDVCNTLKFYCGFNPKKEEDVEPMIAKGLPTLTNVSVKVKHPGYVTVRFDMPYDKKRRSGTDPPRQRVTSFRRGFFLYKFI
jgi:hypothetical protein